ncbi:MAG: haloalkane dehalogenase [Leptospiraceae bacterium]|nr:haloalkane dehalogenase [Leptospiraceae bacterium]
MEILRTPDEQFNNLPGYDFQPHYINCESVRMHYLDENPTASETILLLHGEPSWSYLYRKMIPPLRAAGHRVIAPDLIGFGKSDKPASMTDYSYQNHVDWLSAFVEQLDLQNITLFCQDWGGLLGLRIAMQQPQRFARIIASNTFLPTGDEKPSTAFLQWRDFAQKVKRFPVGKIIQGATTSSLSPAEIAAYNAPFPDESYKAGARIFPALVPVQPDDPAAAANRTAWTSLKEWQKPFLTAFGDSDPITKGAHLVFKRAVPGARGQTHTILKGGGHFIQEDCAAELAAIILNSIENCA